MKTTNRLWIARAALVGLVVVAAAWTCSRSARASAAPMPGYIALGDSIEVGFGDTDPSNGIGYVLPFGSFLSSTIGQPVEVHNLGQLGAETRDIFLNQLSPALQEIQNHRPFGVVISWGGGGNDLLHFVTSHQVVTCLRAAACLARLNALLIGAEHTIDMTILALRLFAGPQAPILMRTQYNGFARSGCPAGSAELAQAALEGLPGTILDRGLNDRIKTIAAKYGAKIVDLVPPFAANPDGLILPDCVHPNGAGYDAILQAFEDAF